jgi:hypothetical protein
LVEVRDCVGLVTNKVIQAVRRVGVDEAIPNPLSSPDGLVDCSNQLNSRLNSILVGFTGVQAIDILLARVAKNIEIFFTGKGNELTRFGPVDLYMSISMISKDHG